MHDRRMGPWVEWKERCAVDLCTQDTQAALLAFGGMRFRTLAQRCLPMINIREVRNVMLSDADAWHLLETHMTIPRSSNGKAYKDWLFARTEGSTDAPFNIVQGGATLLMRSVVREHFRREYSPSGHVSIEHSPASRDEPGAIGEAWLPGGLDTCDAVALRELQQIASDEAARRFCALSTRVRLGLAARHLRVPCSTPALLELAQCGKSAMHATCRDAATSLTVELQRAYPGEDRATLSELSILTFEALTHRCVAWALETPQYRTVLMNAAPASIVKEREK